MCPSYYSIIPTICILSLIPKIFSQQQGNIRIIGGTTCPSGTQPSFCLMDPCRKSECKAYPQAKCRRKTCGNCLPEFYDENGIVDCNENLEKTLELSQNCPIGVKEAKCEQNPCKLLKCKGNLEAHCVPYPCGGCYAVFYDEKGFEVDCDTGKSYDPYQEIIETTPAFNLTSSFLNKVTKANVSQTTNTENISAGKVLTQLHKGPIQKWSSIITTTPKPTLFSIPSFNIGNLDANSVHFPKSYPTGTTMDSVNPPTLPDINRATDSIEKEIVIKDASLKRAKTVKDFTISTIKSHIPQNPLSQPPNPIIPRDSVTQDPNQILIQGPGDTYRPFLIDHFGRSRITQVPGARPLLHEVPTKDGSTMSGSKTPVLSDNYDESDYSSAKETGDIPYIPPPHESIITGYNVQGSNQNYVQSLPPTSDNPYGPQTSMMNSPSDMGFSRYRSLPETGNPIYLNNAGGPAVPVFSANQGDGSLYPEPNIRGIPRFYGPNPIQEQGLYGMGSIPPSYHNMQYHNQQQQHMLQETANSGQRLQANEIESGAQISGQNLIVNESVNTVQPNLTTQSEITEETYQNDVNSLQKSEIESETLTAPILSSISTPTAVPLPTTLYLLPPETVLPESGENQNTTSSNKKGNVYLSFSPLLKDKNDVKEQVYRPGPANNILQNRNLNHPRRHFCPVGLVPYECDVSICKDVTCPNHEYFECHIYNCGGCHKIFKDILGYHIQC